MQVKSVSMILRDIFFEREKRHFDPIHSDEIQIFAGIFSLVAITFQVLLRMLDTMKRQNVPKLDE